MMVIVPHEDDEVLLAAGLLARAVREGQHPRVVMATNGDCGAVGPGPGRTRIRESLAALELLGLGGEAVDFLGYADTGMDKASSFLTLLYNAQDGDQVFRSSWTDRTYGLPGVADDFHSRRWGNSAPYTRNSFLCDLTEVIRTYRPADLFVTSPYDLHGDHSALFAFTLEALAVLSAEDPGYQPRVHHGLVHSPAGDDRWPEALVGADMVPFSMPPGLEVSTPLRWADRESFPVPADMKDPDPTRNLKYRALLEFESALKPEEPDVVRYLLAFVKADEVFWRYPTEPQEYEL